MTADRFVESLEGYYGDYRPMARQVVHKYVSSQYIDKELDRLLQRTILEYSGQYKYPPDVAILEDIKKSINSETSIDLIGYERPKKMIEDMSKDVGTFDPTPLFESLYKKFEKDA